MRYIYTVLLLAIALCTSVTTNAQARLSLRATPSPVSDPTPNLNDQLALNAYLKNESLTDTFTGVLDFVLANKDSIVNIPGAFGKPSYAQIGATITLAPQEQRLTAFTIQLTPSHFSIGVDIIIVWPIASVPVVDSFRAPIDIQAPAGITPLNDVGIRAFVSGEQLLIQKDGAGNIRGRVQIYDQVGRMMGDYPLTDALTAIPLHQLPAGVYIADIKEETGPGRRLKFVR